MKLPVLVQKVLSIDTKDFSQVKDACMHQAINFYEQAVKQVELDSELARLKLLLKQTSAELELEYRGKCEEEFKKVTEKIVDMYLELHPSIKELKEQIQEYERELDKQKVLVEALRQRKDMLMVLGGVRW